MVPMMVIVVVVVVVVVVVFVSRSFYLATTIQSVSGLYKLFP
jgi:hypothetical protein